MQNSLNSRGLKEQQSSHSPLRNDTKLERREVRRGVEVVRDTERVVEFVGVDKLEREGLVARGVRPSYVDL